MEEKKRVGRPTKYKVEFCEDIIVFFTRDYSQEEKTSSIEFGSSSQGSFDKEKTNLRKVGNTLPTFERYAANLGVHTDTLLEWCSAHEEFSVAYKRAKQLQHDMLVQNALLGRYNTAFAIFLARNITTLTNDPMDDVVECELEV